MASRLPFNFVLSLWLCLLSNNPGVVCREFRRIYGFLKVFNNKCQSTNFNNCCVPREIPHNILRLDFSNLNKGISETFACFQSGSLSTFHYIRMAFQLACFHTGLGVAAWKLIQC